MKKKIISIIVPCYNEEGSIHEMYSRVISVFKKLPHYDFELIYVDNASLDGSEAVYTRLSRKDKRVRVIIMSRNFGSPQPSFLAGLKACRGDAAVFLHGDIQDPPEMITKFITYWEKGYNVVYGVRVSRRGYNILWNVLYKGFYFLLNKLAYINIPIDAGEFSLVDRWVIRELLIIDEYDYFLRCLRAFVGFKQIGIPYTRDARMQGRSTESIMSGFWWAKTFLVNFSFKPLEWISTIAFMVTLFSFSLMVFDLFVFLMFKNSLKGIPTIVLLILFLGGVQLLSISVIAEYLAKIFLEVKHRPKYIIRKTMNIKKSSVISHQSSVIGNW